MDTKKVKIISDSTSDLSDELLEKYDISIIPLYVTLAEKTYKDKFEISPDRIYQHFEQNKELPKTSAANVQDHIDMMSKYAESSSGIVYFTLSSEMSSNYNNACIAAEEFDNVYVVDSRNLSTGIGLQLIRAGELSAKGRSAKEIFDEICDMREKVDSSFVLEKLDYLAKGGRCSSVAALGANLLKLRPCIVVRNGKMSVSKKYRGLMPKVFTEYVDDMLTSIDDIDDRRIFITHSTVSEECFNAVYDAVASKHYFKEILTTKAGCTISSHCGEGCLGILFVRKNKISE